MTGRTVLTAVAGAALLATLATVAPAGAAPVPDPTRATAAPGRLGTNLGAVTYYDGIVPFSDLMRQASDWIPQREGQPWGTGASLSLRRDGWPARLAAGQYATAVLAEVRYPRGRYQVSWSGTGTFDINGTTFSGTNGHGVVDLDGTSMVLLNLRVTAVSNPVRAIRVRVPGERAGAQFRAIYLRQLRPYRVLRFMDWQRTNSTLADPVRRFRCTTRVLPGYYSQGTTMGTSVETMIALANTLGVNPWFTIPHEASDDWVRCHAHAVAALLRPGLTPRYEFSNETWNPVFRAYSDLTTEAQSLGLGGSDDYLGLQLRVGQRHARAMRIVGEEMRAAHRSFIRVLSGQAANSWVLQQRLSTGGTQTDEIAIAPYLGLPGANPFDPTEASTIAGLTVSQVLARMDIAQRTEVNVWIDDHLALARSSGKRLVAYEGGQHLAGDSSNDQLTSLFTRTNRNAGIAPRYRTYLNHWRAVTGNSLFMHFSDVGPYTRYGSWGALEFPEQAVAGTPKYLELRRFAAR